MSVLQHQWKTLTVSLADAILTISMNRPKANAMSPELLNELIQIFNQASDDKKVKGVHLCSNLKYLIPSKTN
jgi:enoyl-CoA hydratase/carnithine racemase